MLNKNMIITILIMCFTHIIIWFQLNGQLIWKSHRDNIWLLSIVGIPISYSWLMSTKIGYEAFGSLWQIRLLGFATGMLTFPVMTYFLMGEGITVKTGISMALGIIIMLLQII